MVCRLPTPALMASPGELSCDTAHCRIASPYAGVSTPWDRLPNNHSLDGISWRAPTLFRSLTTGSILMWTPHLCILVFGTRQAGNFGLDGMPSLPFFLQRKPFHSSPPLPGPIPPSVIKILRSQSLHFTQGHGKNSRDVLPFLRRPPYQGATHFRAVLRSCPAGWTWFFGRPPQWSAEC